MQTYSYIWKQELPISIQSAWEFFSNPKNLNEITPENMSFEIKTNLEDEMYSGMLIEYTIRPLFKFPLNWITEITHIKKGKYFIDEQRFGPYKLWHHEHHFEKTEKGVLMTDKLTYAISFGYIGRILNSVFIANQIEGIFNYRQEKLKTMFANKSI